MTQMFTPLAQHLVAPSSSRATCRNSAHTRTKRVNRGLRLAVLASILTGGLGLGGCASNTDLIEANRTLRESNERLLAERLKAVQDLESCQSELMALRQANGELMAFRDELLGENQRLRDALAQFDASLGNLRLSALDPDTDAALRDLAAQYPDLIEYDARRGLLRFKSDFTFGSGSDDVSDQGRRSIDALARILNSPSASGYDVRIVGHTDSQRVRQLPNRPFKDNWELSAFRSISVMRQLVSVGVAPGRVQIAGSGEHDPLVPNSGSGNTPANRRVEVYLYKGKGAAGGAGAGDAGMTPGGTAGVAPGAQPVPSQPRKPVQDDVFK